MVIFFLKFLMKKSLCILWARKYGMFADIQTEHFPNKT